MSSESKVAAQMYRDGKSMAAIRRAISEASVKKMIMKKHGYDEPPTGRPSQQLKKAIGFTVPPPSKFGF